MVPLLAKMRSDELATPLGSKICNWTTVACIVSAVWAVVRCEIAPLRAPLQDFWVKWLLQNTATMALTGWIFMFFFLFALRVNGMTSLYADAGGPLQGLVSIKKMLFLFTALTAFYHIMAFEKGWVHENWLAEWMGVPGVAVYSTRYIEWTFCAPILISVAGHVDAGPDGKPRNGLLPSSLLTGVYCLNSWLGFVVMDAWTAWWNVSISFVAYFAASWEQLVFASQLFRMGRSGAFRSCMLVYMVIMMGIYGLVYIMPLWDLCSTEFEQKLYSICDASFKVGMGSVLLISRQVEDTGLVEEMRRSAETVAEDLQRLIDTASVPIFGIDRDGCINEWNQKTAELTGLNREKAQGQVLFDMFTERCREEGERMFRECLRRGQPGSCELRIKAQPVNPHELMMAKPATLVVSASPRRDSHGTVVGSFGVGYDLTEIKAVKEAEARKTRFMAVVSHELRSPLHGIIGLSDNLCIQEKNDMRAKQLKMVKNCASRLLDLVVNIMDMAALTSSEENGKKKAPKPLARDPVSLPRIIEEVVLLVRNATDKQGHPLIQPGVTLTSDIAEGSLPVIEADAHKCTQVFYNIITNACKFTKKGSIRIFAAVDPAGHFVEVSVADTGKGIAPESRDRIFEPFEQEDNSEMRQYEGIGLGLAIAKEVVHGHGGTISLESEVGVGTTFIVRLPFVMKPQGRRDALKGEPGVAAKAPAAAEAARSSSKLGAARPPPAPQPPPPAPPPPQQKLPEQLALSPAPAPAPPPAPAFAKAPERPSLSRAEFRSQRSGRSEDGSPTKRKPLVLSVDDDTVNQAVIEAALGSEYDIHQAMDGQECLNYFQTHSRLPDVVLLDVMMPGMSGFDVCKTIREDLKISTTTLPILMLSARSPVAQSVIEGLSRGCNDYITKPFEKEVLIARVKTALQIKRLHEVELQSAKDAELLSSIIPPHIIERLQAGEKMIAESHEGVTILFSDIVGWTNIAETLTTSQVVILLNDLFSAFDELTEVNGVYKVETIGDAYMCAAGHDGSHDHALSILKFGLGMVRASQRVRPPSAGLRLQIRVGAHTGPAYTGVVGRKVPRYCFFGDTVNVSSRMESHGTPGCIHISQSTRDALGDPSLLGPGVQILERGTVEIKGKGAMSTHLIVPPGGTVPAVAVPQGKRRSTVCTFNLPADGSPSSPTADAAQQELTARCLELQAERCRAASLREELEAARALAAEEQRALGATKVALERELRLLESAHAEAQAEARTARAELSEATGSFDRRYREVTDRLAAAHAEGRQLEERLAVADGKLAAEAELEASLRRAREELAEGQHQTSELASQIATLEAERTSLLRAASAAAAAAAPPPPPRHAMPASPPDRELQECLCSFETERQSLQAPNAEQLRRLSESAGKYWSDPEGGSPAAHGSMIPGEAVPYLTLREAQMACSSPGAAASTPVIARVLDAKEQLVQHLRLELRMKDQRLQATRATLASLQEELDAKDAELQHVLIDLRAALGR